MAATWSTTPSSGQPAGAILRAVSVVLVSGVGERAAAVTAALTEAGWQCHTAADLPAVQAVVAELGDERVDAYVQLPVSIESTATTATGRIRDLLVHGLVARFDAAERAVELVRDGGTVVLVAGNSPGERELNDDQRARYALLRVLSHTILADHEGRDIRAVVVPGGRSAGDVVAALTGTPSSREQSLAEFVDRDSDLNYADWRLELLSMATNES